jgi:dienelactone hydrolase
MTDPDPFGYDASLPLELDERSHEQRDAAVVRNIAYRDAEIGEVEAFLVQPREPGPGPGVLFLHWFDTEAPDGNRSQFIDEAFALAKRGVASLLPQGSFPWASDPSDAARDAERIGKEVVRHRRGLDLLIGQGGVDPGRIGLVGHDFGAMYAAALVSVDRRPRGRC